ncbi:RING-H2 finger protein ATL65 [Bienertia sinuspersici]
MTNQDLKKLPCFEYTQNEAKQSTTTATSSVNDCAVCLETFKVGDNCRLLPNCQHYFHVYCVDEWLMKSPFCPICRTCTAFVAAKLSPKVGSSDIVPPDIDIDSNNRHPHQSTTVTNYVVAEESC